MNPRMIQPTALFSANDSGLVALPAEVTAARTARDRAEEHLRDLAPPTHPLSVRDEVTAATVEAFLAGKRLPPIDAITAAEAEARAFEHRLEIGRNTLEALDRHLDAAMADRADSIITGSLRPVFDKLVAELRDALILLEPFEGASRGALAAANARVRKAAGTYDAGRDTFGLLVAAAQEVRRLASPPVHDVDNEFGLWRDLHTAWPRERRTNFGAIPAPWEEAPDPLAWQLRRLRAWMPTAAEMDAAWVSVYGDKAREQQVIREKGRAMALTFGQGH